MNDRPKSKVRDWLLGFISVLSGAGAMHLVVEHWSIIKRFIYSLFVSLG